MKFKAERRFRGWCIGSREGFFWYRPPELPKFLREDAGSFFVIAEASFRRAHIRSESIKADYLIASLDLDLVPHIRHIIEADPKPADVYTQIKNRLIASFSISAETRLR